MKRYLALLLAAFLFITPSLLPSERAGALTMRSSPNLSALEVIAEVNALRAAGQLPPYQVNSVLMSVAQTHADYIAASGVISHFNADGKAPYQRASAAGYSVAGDISKGGLFSEAIGSGAGLSASEVVGIWQDDGEDLKALINPELKDIGVGLAVKNGITYYVLNAGASLGVGTPSPSPTSGTPSALVAISTALEDGSVFHIVQKDEGLWGIALAYDTTIEQLQALNGLATDEIFIGQKLLIQKPDIKTMTPTVEIISTATFGIPTSTATRPVTPTVTSTATPLPVAPTSRRSGGLIVGGIVLAALFAAGIGAWLGKRRSPAAD